MENLDIVNQKLSSEDNQETLSGESVNTENIDVADEVKTEENTSTPELTQLPPEKPSCSSGKNGCKCWHWLVTLLLLGAVIALFVLHFTSKNQPLVLPEGQDHTGVILTVNNDSILEYFELVSILKSDLEAESDKYTKDMQGKYKNFQTKVNNYQINVQNQVLTQTQMQNAERDLAREQQELQDLESRYTTILANKEMSVQNEITDSIINATKRVNDRKYKADYVFATAKGSAIICANPTFDITQEVIDELNSAYKKSRD
ncbi:MAG: OmpH family outer membrane protein [Bacteroidales bacterium]|nr:OmpH family outer membrane protein [Bacteroidales bacterium]